MSQFRNPLEILIESDDCWREFVTQEDWAAYDAYQQSLAEEEERLFIAAQPTVLLVSMPGVAEYEMQHAPTLGTMAAVRLEFTQRDAHATLPEVPCVYLAYAQD